MYFETAGGHVRAVDDVSLSIDAGETVGIVGESASGKTSLALSILRLLPRNARIFGGEILLNGRDLLRVSEAELQEVRWKQIAMIFQGAMNALNPVFTVGHQLTDILIRRAGIPRREALRRAGEALEAVGISPRRLTDYPHQFSGGMKQRIGIAMSLLCRPQLVIADEPTTALDVITQDEVLGMLERVQRDFGMAMIYISHDISMIAERCARLAIMYAGELVETGRTEEVTARPIHPYTMALLESVPTLETDKELRPIPGAASSLLNPSEGCRFLPRCPYGQALCENRPPWVAVAEGRGALCHFAGALPESSQVPRQLQYGSPG